MDKTRRICTCCGTIGYEFYCCERPTIQHRQEQLEQQQQARFRTQESRR